MLDRDLGPKTMHFSSQAAFRASSLFWTSCHRLTPGCPRFASIIIFGFSMSIADLRVDGATCAYRMVIVIVE
jgi:hypothetical protein